MGMLSAVRLNSRAGTERLPVSSLNGVKHVMYRYCGFVAGSVFAAAVQLQCGGGSATASVASHSTHRY